MYDKKAITSLDKKELAALVEGLGQPAFRAKQVFEWLHAKRVQGFDEMTNLPQALRQRLEEGWYIETAQARQVQQSRDGTAKLLLQLHDGCCVESVLMRYEHGYSVCISSQVGCRMGCAFCASARGGLQRSLGCGEMLAQVYAAARMANERVGHVVLMGMGEPLDNYDEVLKFLRLVCDADGYGLSGRSISLSTSGVVPQIERLADEKLGLTLSVSLHATNDRLRDSLMPVNKSWPLKQLLGACAAYQKKTGRRISFEYAMIRGVNDSLQDAAALAALLQPMGNAPPPHVNLIAMNAVEGTGFEASERAQVEAFAAALVKKGVNATVRRRLGADIDAACGQLRLREMEKSGSVPV